MIELLRGTVPEALWPIAFVVVFLVVCGSALYLTPRIAKWLDGEARRRPGYFDGMMEKAPDPAKDGENGAKEEEK